MTENQVADIEIAVWELKKSLEEQKKAVEKFIDKVKKKKSKKNI